MSEVTEYGMFGVGELMVMFLVNIAISVATGVLLALLCKWLFKKWPGIWPAIQLMPWRGVTVIAMLAFTPGAVAAFSIDRDGIWSQIIQQILPSSENYMERLSVVSILYQLSLLATAWTGALLVRLWIISSSISVVLSAVRSFAMIAIVIMINVQMFTGKNSGLGGALYDSAMMYDWAAASAAWMQIVWLVIAVDFFFGVVQFITNWVVEHRKNIIKVE
jgi:hypothetical protein